MSDDRAPEQTLVTWQVADLLRVLPVTIRRWIRRGTLKGFRLPNGEYRVRAADLEAFLEAGKVRSLKKRRIT